MRSFSTPVIVGVGDFKNASLSPSDAQEPLQLMLRAINTAAKDTQLPSAFDVSDLLSSADSIQVVRTWTWPYGDLPGLIAERLGAKPTHKVHSDHGGNQPAKLVDEAARRIAKGESKIAIVTGGEALASLGAYFKVKKEAPPWTESEQEVDSVFSPTSRELASSLGATHGIGAPIQVYPLYENGFRAHRRQSIQENHAESARLYAGFAKIAEQNPMSCNYGKAAETDESIATVTERNRMICFPYPLLMNAFNNVNIAAACILTSTEHADELGIPQSQWIYPLGGAGTRDSSDFWLRPNFYTSPSISKSLDAALEVTGLVEKDIDIYDMYSCFPIVPKLACSHLGISITRPEKPISLLGGLTSFGGAGNNYSMHAITHMAHHLRAHRNRTPTPSDITCPLSLSTPSDRTLSSVAPRRGLILANGGTLTYQHVLILSSHPTKDPQRSYPAENPLPEELNGKTAPELYGGLPAVLDDQTTSSASISADRVTHAGEVEVNAEGARAGSSTAATTAAGKEKRSSKKKVVIETYTIDYTRSGVPERAYIVGRVLGSGFGERFIANHADKETLGHLNSASKRFEEAEEEWSGRVSHSSSSPSDVAEEEAREEVVGRQGWIWKANNNTTTTTNTAEGEDEGENRWLFSFRNNDNDHSSLYTTRQTTISKL